MNARDSEFYLGKGSFVSGRYQKSALVTGILGLVASAIGYFLDSSQFYHSYLVAFGFWATLSLGGMFFVMLHHLTGATWSVVVRRQAESVMAVLPYLAIFFIPVLFGIKDLYPWARHETEAVDLALRQKSLYLNVAFFVLRAIVFFALWIILAVSLYRTSRRQDGGHTKAIGEKMKKLSAGGMVIFAFTVTFAAIDWFMSQNPHWYSTIFGVYIFAGGLVSTIAFLTVVSLNLRKQNILSNTVTEEHYHDLGKLAFAFVVFWAYIAFSQYFLIWYANIPEETVWFGDRWRGSWKYISLLIVIGYFVIPFILLISRGMKRKLAFMKIMAVWLLFMHWVDLYWVIAPNLRKSNAWISWMDIAAMLGIGGIFMWLLWRRLFSGALVPVNDPRLDSSIKFINY